jgi:hypothetical protein
VSDRTASRNHRSLRTAPRRGVLLALLCLAAVIAAFLVPPVSQDPTYHDFADARTVGGIPNFWNVVSNFGYLMVGIYGLLQVRRLSSPLLLPGYVTFCVAVTLVALGSAWYHIAPTTQSLVWDRLPMSAGFMALFALTLGDRVSWRLARISLWPLVLAGAASVIYWAWSEQRGAGDLRLYGLVQFLPILLMPLLLLLYPGSRRSAMWLWCALAGYVIAKIAELSDDAIHALLGMGGHGIKHLASAAAALFAVFAVREMDAPPELTHAQRVW